MRRFRRGAMAGVVLGILGAGPLAAGSAPATAAEVPRIEAAELQKLVARGEVVIIDVRSREAYDTAHAEGALHIALDDLAARLKELPKDKLIAAYCT
jgi:predicted sulfurtransferase